jgi:hypothetical protein
MRRRDRSQLSTRGALVSRLVVVASAVALFGALPASASAYSFGGGFQIQNDSNYSLVFDHFEGNHVARWLTKQPKDEPRIAPHQASSTFKWVGDNFEPTSGTVFYNVVDQNSKQLGHVAYTVRIDCRVTCLFWARSTDGRSWPGPPVWLNWTDNDGNSVDFIGTLQVIQPNPAAGAPRSCPLGGLGPRFANVNVHGIACGRAKAVIQRGRLNQDHRWRVRRWACSQSRGHGRLHVKCKRAEKRISFDID